MFTVLHIKMFFFFSSWTYTGTLLFFPAAEHIKWLFFPVEHINYSFFSPTVEHINDFSSLWPLGTCVALEAPAVCVFLISGAYYTSEKKKEEKSFIALVYFFHMTLLFFPVQSIFFLSQFMFLWLICLPSRLSPVSNKLLQHGCSFWQLC